MRILEIDKFFYNRGGSSKVFFDTISCLKQAGHDVFEFSMNDPRNLPSEYSKYFISQLPELKNEMTFREKWKIFKHLFRSKEVEDKLNSLICETRPDVAHLHNVYHHLSASTFLALKKRGVAVVLTLHDVFPLCPNHSLMHGESLREDLFKNKPYNCIRYRCIDNKFLPSLAGTLEAYYYRIQKIWNSVDIFICPSEFMRDKMIEYGFPECKMRVVKNPFSIQTEPLPLGDKVVYLGRLHAEKGIKIFMEAAKNLRNYQIIIAGTGPEEKWVEEFVKKNNLRNIELRGWVEGADWEKVMNEAKIVVVPSVFLENCSITILEALSRGRLVVASKRGGNPELIINGETGFLCRPEDPEDLAEVVKTAMKLNNYDSEFIVKNGRSMLEKHHNPDNYIRNLLHVFDEAKRNICG